MRTIGKGICAALLSVGLLALLSAGARAETGKCADQQAELQSSYRDVLTGVPGGKSRLARSMFDAVTCLGNAFRLEKRDERPYVTVVLLLAHFNGRQPMQVSSPDEAHAFAEVIRSRQKQKSFASAWQAEN